jgi:hypothetical protein
MHFYGTDDKGNTLMKGTATNFSRDEHLSNELSPNVKICQNALTIHRLDRIETTRSACTAGN